MQVEGNEPNTEAEHAPDRDVEPLPPGLEEIIYRGIGDMEQIRSVLRAGQVAAMNSAHDLGLTPNEVTKMLADIFEATAALIMNAIELMDRSERENFRHYQKHSALKPTSNARTEGNETTPGDMETFRSDLAAGRVATSGYVMIDTGGANHS